MSIEDEMHFLVDCKTFLPLRSDLLVKVEDITENINVRRMEKKVLFTYLLTNPRVPPLIAKYLTRAMEHTGKDTPTHKLFLPIFFS